MPIVCVDTNLWFYALARPVDGEQAKHLAARGLIGGLEQPVITPQIINELSANLLRKRAWNEPDLQSLIADLHGRCRLFVGKKVGKAIVSTEPASGGNHGRRFRRMGTAPLRPMFSQRLVRWFGRRIVVLRWDWRIALRASALRFRSDNHTAIRPSLWHAGLSSLSGAGAYFQEYVEGGIGRLEELHFRQPQRAS